MNTLVTAGRYQEFVDMFCRKGLYRARDGELRRVTGKEGESRGARVFWAQAVSDFSLRAPVSKLVALSNGPHVPDLLRHARILGIEVVSRV